MPSAFTSLPRSSETIFEDGSESVELTPMEDTASTNPRKFYQTHVIFLAYLSALFTITLAICSIIAEINDTNEWMRFKIPSHKPDIAAFFAIPYTLFYLIWSYCQPRLFPNLSPSTFGRIHVACTSILAFLWWISALNNVERIGNVDRARIPQLGFNRLRASIAILAAIQTVFFLLMCISFLHQMWKRHYEGGSGYTGLPISMPRIRVMVNDTAYIDVPRSSFFRKPGKASNLRAHEEGAEEGGTEDVEKLLNSREPAD